MDVELRSEPARVVGRADVDFNEGSEFVAVSLPGQRCPAARAKTALNSRRRFVFRAIALRIANPIFLEAREDNDRRAGVFAILLSSSLMEVSVIRNVGGERSIDQKRHSTASAASYHSPTLGIEAQGSFAGSGSPS